MPKWIEITAQIIIGGLMVSPILGPIFYFSFVRDHLYNYREKKCRRLYPEYFKLLDARDDLRYNQLHEAIARRDEAEDNIDSINQNMPYTPLEDMTSKRMEIEVLKKERIKAQEEVEDYEAVIDEYNRQMREIRQDNKKLTKLYNMQ